jgi:hypothetical protein
MFLTAFSTVRIINKNSLIVTKMGWASFVAIFSQTRLVTLLPVQPEVPA